MNGESFRFHTSSDLVELTGKQARNLNELLRVIRTARGAEIFHHLFQTLREHHLFLERYPNDFADWVHNACGEPVLAERLAGVDIRGKHSLAELRGTIVDVLKDYIEENPAAGTRPARTPFYLCSSISVVVPTGIVVKSVEEFRDAVAQVSLQSIYHHFVTARIRVDLATNDFSAWLGTSMNRPDLAERLDRIDLTMLTLEGVRNEILEALE
ncbi:MAG: hypothetical protein D6679_00595 [Candidatus Hydrogenedentota bacterium]|nr:MAG: hypothetical protein D6679_00595 [Candidatus Hydrogenedentota bacterium]